MNWDAVKNSIFQRLLGGSKRVGPENISENMPSGTMRNLPDMDIEEEYLRRERLRQLRMMQGQ